MITVYCPKCKFREERPETVGGIGDCPNGCIWDHLNYNTYSLGDYEVISEPMPLQIDIEDYYVCKNCGSDMIGDGYTMTRHCETLDIIGEGYEPDCAPIYCKDYIE